MRKEVRSGLVAGCLLALPLNYVMAESRGAQAVSAAAERQSAGELLAQLRFMNLQPAGVPQRVGQYYVLQATDTHGRTFRVVADAELGDILSVFPMRQAQWRFESGPRVIHVPDAAGDVTARDVEGVAARPASATEHRTVEEGPPALQPARASAPNALSPIYPTPKFGKKNGSASDASAH